MRNTEGYIAITAVLVLSALFLSVSVSIASRGITASDTSLAQHTSVHAHYVAEACIEHGLMRLQDTLGYEGGETVAVGDDQCVLMPIEGTGISNRTLQAYSMIDGYTYRIEVVAAVISPTLEIASYDRVSAF